MTTIDLDEPPCFQYKSGMDELVLTTVKFRVRMDDDEYEEFKLRQFDGSGGIEALLTIEDEFDTKREQAAWTNADCATHFVKLLKSTALSGWKNVQAGMTVAERTANDSFNRQMKKFYLLYCTDTARDTMQEYLRSSECRKPVSYTSTTNRRRCRTIG